MSEAGGTLTFTAEIHSEVRRHLFPGDGLEAAAILICSKVPGPRLKFLTRRAVLVPYDACRVRESDRITWPGLSIEEAIDIAESDRLSLFLLHSHPGGLFGFSELDNLSDSQTMPGLFTALDCGHHGSALMIPNGAVAARIYTSEGQLQDLDLVSMAADDLHYWWRGHPLARRPNAFTSDMTAELARLSACVVGVSGTGSIVAEQVARLGFGGVTLIDFDHLEKKNLNRILNSTLDDASAATLKVDMFARAIGAFRGPGVACAIPEQISTRDAVLAASQCDVLFSCVDSLEARNICDLIAASFLIPLFDVGVAIPTRHTAEGRVISDACGRIDYVRPGGPTLADRKVYTPESLRAEYIRAVAPDEHRGEVEAGYLKGIADEAPAVISLNMRASSAVVLEFLSRAFPYRHDGNAPFAQTQFSIAASDEDFRPESAFDIRPNANLARGDAEPLLGMPSLRHRIESSNR
ncbi:ThiF family adenylyltransferase [Caballeronia sp. GACF4]|uniref:ThiF family adenylyltransferase n=1 Tax=Caballeronia sp. GACF4 TaxID=2921763 RepID=UPI002028C6B0|nr:ThiF family adenylyltransferase [Caballeronia sp. GACF4]